ncbi:MAG: methyl-accepting chemotaxis protein, partial [Burkholderiales bacterium]
MKLGTRLMVAPAVTGAMLLLALGTSIGVLGWYQDKSEFAHQQVLAALTKVTAVQTQLGDVHTRLYRTITIVGSLDDKAVKAEREQQGSKLAAVASEATKAADAAADDAIQKDLRSFVGQVSKYQKSADSAIDMSTVDPNTGVAALQSADADFKTLAATLASVLDRVGKRATETTLQLESMARLASWALAAAGLLAVLGALAFSWLTQRRVVSSIHQAAQAAALVAQGRLDVQAHSDDKDEVGDLVRALGTMVGQLRASMQTVQAATQSIGTASAEIATGNQDLSQRTEQTAS